MIASLLTGMIQGSKDYSQDSSSKQNTNELRDKESKDSEKNEALQAFRTITTMLSLIQSTGSSATNQPNFGREKKLVKLLDAIAAVLVRNHGVIAVTGRLPDDDPDSGKMEVLASYSGNEESLTISQSWSTAHFMDSIRNFFVSQNPRDSTVKERDVIDPETSVSVQFKDIKEPAELLDAFLTEVWPLENSQAAMDSRNSFELHTWMTARFIETSGRCNVHLSHYVIAVCYKRMITRMTYRVSESFRDALKNLPPTFEFPKGFPLIGAISNKHDEKFIQTLIEVQSSLQLRTPIDNLVKHKKDFYNRETYMDFHSILIEILELFLESLAMLKKIHGDLLGKPPSPTQLSNIKSKINFIAVVGTLLRLLVKSQAIKRCLHSVDWFLPDRAVKPKVEKKTDDDDDERDRNDEEDGLFRCDEEEEDELEGDGNASLKLEPKSQACLRLLNLGVVYIDAILVLSDFIKKKNSDHIKINISILRLPCRSNDKAIVSMLPWRTLLQHETYFPGKPYPSAKDILDFLESLASSTSKKSQKSTEVSPESVKEDLAGLRLIHDSNIFTSKIDQAINLLTTLQDSDTATPGLAKCIQSIIGMLKGLYPDKVDMNYEIDEIAKKLKTLSDNTKLERMLRKGLPLDTGNGFKGNVHAEASIAAHCTFTEPQWFPPSSTVRAAGVSKFCCPACGFVLRKVEPPFIFTNTHNIITSCSLPSTLSLDVIKAAVAQFGGQLREELGQLMMRTDMLDSCDESINSQDFSVGSFGSDSEFKIYAEPQ